MSNEKTEGTILVSNTSVRIAVDIDEIRKAGTENGPNTILVAVAQTLLREIDRLNERVTALEGRQR